MSPDRDEELEGNEEGLDALDFSASPEDQLRDQPESEPEPEPTPEPEPEPEPERELPERQATEDQPKEAEEAVSTEEAEVEKIMVGDQEVTVPEGIDPELFKKMATHYNQVGHFQQLAEQRASEIEQIQQQNQAVLNDYVQRQMYEEQQAQLRAQQEQMGIANERPGGEQLMAQFGPYIKQLHEQGRVSIDEMDEHSGLIGEYLYDQARTAHTLQTGFGIVDQRIRQLEELVIPDLQQRTQQNAVQRDNAVREEVAAMDGYEDLQTPENWERLKAFVADKVVNSPRDQYGNPTFDPIFDGPTMAQMYDAMTGQIMRQAMAKNKEARQATDKVAAQRASGVPASTGNRPAAPSSKPSMTEESDALDFGDPRKATG